MKYLIFYIIIINFISLLIYGIDKWLAKKNKYRVSERILFILSFFGGALGALLGMLLFRHKTKKIYFYIWNIIMLVMWSYIIYRYMKVGG